MRRTKTIGFALAISMSVALCACGASDISDQVANVVQAEDEHVLAVKGGTPNAYPDKKFGEAFEDFFGSPTWRYFVGTKEGPDDDGDGEPDYTEDNLDVVEFTGYCTYRDTEVKAKIQFTLSDDGETFEASFLSFNDVPQTNLMLIQLLETVFTNGEDDAADAGDDNVYSTEEVSNEDNDNTYQDNAYQDKFNQPDVIDHSAQLVGTWTDTTIPQCYMDISCADGVNYDVEIDWVINDFNEVTWSLQGTFDEDANGIHYTSGTKTTIWYQGGEQDNIEYTDGEGLLWIGDTSCIYWENYTEGNDGDIEFEFQKN
jgi:hypothetical protein